jgi:hypothetical protein
MGHAALCEVPETGRFARYDDIIGSEALASMFPNPRQPEDRLVIGQCPCELCLGIIKLLSLPHASITLDYQRNWETAHRASPFPSPAGPPS